MQKVDILAIGVHPDDVELSCSGTILKHISLGKSCAILDLTKGELGTRGSAELRTVEAENSAKVLGLTFREQLDLKDVFFENNEYSIKEICKVIRACQPEIILANAIDDRHPDHGRAAKLIADACFYAGLSKIETQLNGVKQAAWRPKALYHYIQDQYIHPDFVVDVTEYAEKKRESIMCFSSQFFDPKSAEPQTPISSPEFIESLFAKMSIWGRAIGVKYAEGFTVARYPGVTNLFDLI